ncbi:oligomycin resistance ATP-dependent permease Yor1p [Diutina catenulata]
MEDPSLENGVLSDEYAPQRRMLSWLIPSKEYPIPTDDERKYFPYRKANPISRLFFWWYTPLLRVGYQRTITTKDLYKLTEELTVEDYLARFDAIWDEKVPQWREKWQRQVEEDAKKAENQPEPETEKDSDKGDSFNSDETAKPKMEPVFRVTNHQMFYLLFLTFRTTIIIMLSILIFGLSCLSVTPLLSKELIKFVSLRSVGLVDDVGRGIGYAIGLFLLGLAASYSINHFFFRSMFIGTKVKAMLTKRLLDKSLVLSPHSHHRFADSKITSMMSTDLARIELGCFFFPIIFGMPIPVIVSIVILIVNIGGAAAIALACLLLFMGSLGIPVKYMVSFRTAASKITDKRVSLTKQVLTNLKMIKFYSWESSFMKQLVATRGDEVAYVKKIQTLRNAVFALATTLPGITSLIAFLILYGLEGSTRNAAEMFSSVGAFEILTMFVFFIPFVLSAYADMMAGFRRIGAYLAAQEVVPYPGYIVEDRPDDPAAIELHDASFIWEEFDPKEVENFDDDKKKPKKKRWWNKKKDEETTENESEKSSLHQKTGNFPGLNHLNLTINKGEFVVITGAIGTGKTSLLNAMAGFMTATSGTININAPLLMCGDPWVQNSTIRENIVFGKPWDKEWYDKVVYACSLQADLAVLPGGDMTEVGERGITLSGGQKARLNLARSVYAQSDILLMDDVLSAVDARVGKHIVENCFLDVMADTTRVIATHQLSLIGDASKVIYVPGDGSIDVGSESELRDRNPGFAQLLTHVAKVEDDDIEEELEEVDPKKPEEITEATYHDVYTGKVAEEGKIIGKEEVAVNQISKDVFYEYLVHGTGRRAWPLWLITFGLVLAIATFCEIFTNTWLSFWVSRKWPHRSDGWYIGFYVMFVVCWIIFLFAAYYLLVSMLVTSSRKMHLKALNRVMHVPMRYMDVTPMGRIINRFTKDTDSLDNEISEQMRALMVSIARLVGTFILVIIYIPWFAIVVPVFIVVLLLVVSYYLATAREIKRIEAVQRSFVFNNFNEVLTGKSTIKAYHHEQRFSDLNQQLLNNVNEASYLVYTGQRWLEVLLDTFGQIIALIVSILCACRVFKIDAASAGLLISYSANISNLLTQTTRTYAQVETDLNSAERIQHYALKLDQEAPSNLPSDPAPGSWPTAGEITFDNVVLQYRPGLPNVLNNLSFTVNAGEKVGICGRTGAGKSSIMSALYRLVELTSGTISIDGVDVSTLGLSALRSNLSIIPQDPVLFQGSIRSNLDPFGNYPDTELWDALRRAHLITEEDLKTVDDTTKETMHKFHLDQNVENDGANFSLGERQLLSFARALIRNTKILIMDEATSSVDFETDHKIQMTIKSEFADCTILCIAHRLKTIVSYDRILALDNGQVAQFDSPLTLFEQDGIFKQMCERAQIRRSDFD